MITEYHLGVVKECKTPFYLYNIDLLQDTLCNLVQNSVKYGFVVHYAVKANSNIILMKEISSYGLGADCVSGNEIKLALQSGFKPDTIVFAGVGKTDEEILLALEQDIFCFNCESVQELLIINDIAACIGKIANVALRINPDVNASTHAHITTGLKGNKFGLSLKEINEAKDLLPELKNINFIGLHFHIGSQITDMRVFENLSKRINQLVENEFNGAEFRYINVGGGLGINYNDPQNNSVPDFSSYFRVFKDNLKYNNKQEIHFELGRSVVGQCGSLITKTILVKGDENKKIAVVDAGMNDLLRPALYGAFHLIKNLTSTGEIQKYDVVGPVCETADCFGLDIDLNRVTRGDALAVFSCGAYGEVMSSAYNMRDKIKTVFVSTSADVKLAG